MAGWQTVTAVGAVHVHACRGRGGATTVQTQLKPQVHQALFTQRRERLAPQFFGVPASLDARVARAIELFRVCGHHRHAKVVLKNLRRCARADSLASVRRRGRVQHLVCLPLLLTDTRGTNL